MGGRTNQQKFVQWPTGARRQGSSGHWDMQRGPQQLACPNPCCDLRILKLQPKYMAFGQYTRGMFSGLMSSTYRFPYTVQYLTRFFEEFCPQDKFATVTVSEDVGMACHRDVHNERDSLNIVLPLLTCDGGGLWVESEPDQFSMDDEWRPLPTGEWRRGKVHAMEAGAPIRFNARRWHQTEPFQGRRLVVIGYTPRMGALQKETYDALLDLGFNPAPFPDQDVITPTLNMLGMVPGSGSADPMVLRGQVPHVDKDDEDAADQVIQALQTLQEDMIDRFQERAQCLRELLAEEEAIEGLSPTFREAASHSKGSR